MNLTKILLFHNLGLFLLELIGYHLCHSVVMALSSYYQLFEAMMCTVRIVTSRVQFVSTPRYTYGLARIGVVGEIIAFISILSFSVVVFFESIKHAFDVIFVFPKFEQNESVVLTAHGEAHHHSLIDHPRLILLVGLYATLSNFFFAALILRSRIRRKFGSNKNLDDSPLITDTLSRGHTILGICNGLIGSVAILICGILLEVLSGELQIRIFYSRLVDPAICVLLFISYLITVLTPMRSVIPLVLQAHPDGLKIDEIEIKLLAAIPGVVRLHDLHIWCLTPKFLLATVHIVFNTTEKIHEKYREIHRILRDHKIQHVTIQPEFVLSPEAIEQLELPENFRFHNEEKCGVLQKQIKPPNEKRSSSSDSINQNRMFRRRSSFSLTEDDETTNFESNSKT